jgi:putative peptide maturation system protein
MSTLETPVASLPGVSLSLGQLLQTLHAQGRLRPLVVEALAGRLVQQEARQAGLSVTAEELQATADAFRRTHGLHTATATRTWLDGQGLTVGDFEAGLEERLLAAKLKQHQTAAQADESFAAHRTDFEQLRVARVVTDRDDLARELTSQVRDEGRDMEGVAREHGLPVARGRLFRRDLPGPLAEALATAQPGELVGPVGTPEGFALLLIEECRPAELDSATRQRIQDELFEGWLAARMKEASFDPGTFGRPA